MALAQTQRIEHRKHSKPGPSPRQCKQASNKHRRQETRKLTREITRHGY